jgi:hypothetical protein
VSRVVAPVRLAGATSANSIDISRLVDIEDTKFSSTIRENHSVGSGK